MSQAILTPIAHIHSDFSQKFGIPRQSGLVEQLTACIVFEEPFRNRDALRSIEGFSHLWLIWQFSEALINEFRPTVRPPRLGGNRRVGVFASRAPYRPNGLGLSCVRLLAGTPIFDIKPYLPFTDCHPEATPGYTAETIEHKLHVKYNEQMLECVPEEKRDALLGVLACDPRPGYEDNPDVEYGLAFAEFDIGFRVSGDVLTVTRIELQK